MSVGGDRLVASLVEQVRELADSRELELDLNLSGRPLDLRAAIAEVVGDAVRDALEVARQAPDLHHLAFAIDYRADSVYVKIEHDGALDASARSRAEGMVVDIYGRVGGLGGGVAFSLGRGFGLRLEVTVPYSGVRSRESGVGTSSFPSGEGVGQRGSLGGDGMQSLPLPLVDRLTPQEESCLALLSAGYSNKEIAVRLHISVGTVKFHLAQIYQKLGVQGRGRGAAVARARELGLIFD